MGKDDDPGDGPATTRAPAKKTATAKKAPAPSGSGKSAYTIRPGDTLSAISLRTGVPVARIRELNKDLDVQALQPGQRLKLRP